MEQPLCRARLPFGPCDRRALSLSICLALLAGGPTAALSAPDAGPLSLGNMPEGASALSVPASSTWQGTDLQLLSVVWAGHTAVVGMAVQPVVEGHDPSVPSLAPGYQVGIYAQDDWQLSPTLAATLGLRIDRDTATSSQLRPRAGLVWRVAPDTSLKALFGRAHRAPAVGESGYNDISTLNTSPLRGREQSEALEVEAEQRVGGGLTLNAMAYSWTVRDVTAHDGIEPVSGLPQLQSVAEVEARGFELSADQVWAAGARLRGSASLQDAVCANGTALPGSPQWLGKLLLSAPLPWAGMHLGVEWRYEGDRVGLDGSPLGASTQSNLTLASAEFADGLVWSMSVLNLFDARDVQAAAAANGPNALEQDRRSLHVRLAYSF